VPDRLTAPTEPDLAAQIGTLPEHLPPTTSAALDHKIILMLGAAAAPRLQACRDAGRRN
jgi:hypothetical protein